MKNSLRILSLLFITSLLSGCGVQSIPQSNNAVEARWADVLSQYQRRADLIPNLVEVVKGYAKHEKETLENVIKARASATQVQVNANDLTPEKMAEFQRAQGQLTGALSRLMVVAEQYPNLKANQNFRDLQVQLEGTENRINYAREQYIESVNQFNNLVTVFPTSLTNKILFHFEKKPQFSVENEQDIKKAPAVKF